MARKKKGGGGGEGQPAWLITFSDLMTLLLTFFVLLVSMAVIDERHKLVVLGSVSTAFGIGAAQFNPISLDSKNTKVEPGAMDTTDLSALKNMLWEDMSHDLNFQENRYVQILSVNADLLFAPGQTTLSDKGREFLNRIIPTLLRVKYPVLIAGHTANRRDEEGRKYEVEFDKTKLDSTWALSLARSQAVYAYLIQSGIPSSRLTQEAFGQYHPRFSDKDSAGRSLNRRVDIVLDRRNAPEILDIERSKEPPPNPKSRYLFRDFQFDLPALPGRGRGER